MSAHKVAIVGLGTIALNQHVPALKANPAFDVVAAASPGAPSVDGVRVFETHGDMLDAVPGIDAVVICTPPQVRYQIAYDALRTGKHVLLEKPPTATLSELLDLERIASDSDKSLFAAWHARYNGPVDAARKALSGQLVRRMAVSWKEDVRRWHPGQEWIWQAGGFGVFDPGINALSILTRIAPEPLFVRHADLWFPSNADTPIAADLTFASRRPDDNLHAEFDWRQAGAETWNITIEIAQGSTLELSNGGRCLRIDGHVVADEPRAEYRRIYEHFDCLLKEGRSDVDAAPLRLVADAFMNGRRCATEPFERDVPVARSTVGDSQGGSGEYQLVHPHCRR